MAWTVDDIFRFTKFLTRKNQTGAIRPDDLFLAWNSEQRSYQGDLLGRFQPRANSKSGQNTGLIENESVFTALAPFTILSTASVAITGNLTKPSNLIYLLAMRVGSNRVNLVNKGQIYSVLRDSIDPPSIAKGMYYATEYDTFYKVWPASPPSSPISVDVEYIRDTNDITWGFTPDVNGVAQYDAGASVQPLWRTADIQEITKRTLKLFGVSFSSQDFQNFGNQTVATGS